MTPEKIKKAVEEFPHMLGKQEKLQKRLINLSGRDPEQEIIIMQQLHSVEQTIEFIDYAIFDGAFLTDRENIVVEYRTRGVSYEKIGETFSITRQGVTAVAERAYKKMAKFAKEQNIG